MTWNLVVAIMAIRGSPPIYAEKETKDETGNSCFSY